MNKQPIVSILINNYNYAKFLEKSIQSALEQTYYSIEIVVVDDGSQDNSREIISQYGNKIISVFKPNGGQASAFNAGLVASRGEIICFLDADDYFHLEKVSQIVDYFRQYPDAGWVFHHLEDVDTEEKILEIDRKENIFELSYLDLREKIINGENLGYFPATSGLCFQRHVLEKFFPMPEELLISADQFLRLAAIYLAPGLLSPSPLAVHRIHGANLFEFRTDKNSINAKINIQTCYYLRKKFPKIYLYTDRIYAHSAGKFIGENNLLKTWQISEFKLYWQEFFSRNLVFSGITRICFNYLKTIVHP